MKGMQKISRGRGFKGALSYALGRDADHKHEPGVIIGGNCGTDEKTALATLIRASSLRKDIQKPVWHNALRLPAGEHIEPEKLSAIADAYMVKMGFSDAHPRVYVMHDDADGQHVHIIASRVSMTGEVYLGQNENLISTRHIQSLELEHGLQITKGPEYHDEKIVMPGKSALKKGEIEMSLQTGAEPTRQRLQRIIDTAITDRPTTAQLIERLEAAGVGIKANLAKTGRMNGFSFELDSVPFKASDLGKAYAWMQLEKRIDYDQVRDSEVLQQYSRTARDRAYFEQPTDAAREPATGAADERSLRSVSAADRAAGAEHGGFDRRNAPDAGRINQGGSERGDREDGSDQPSGERLERSGGAITGSDQRSGGASVPSAPSAESDRIEAHGHSIFSRSGHSSAISRIMDMAGTTGTTGASDSGRSGNRAVSSPGADRTVKAVAAQIAAFDCPEYDVGIRNEKTGQMQNKHYSRDQILDAIPWLKRQNARGEHIYIRPGSEQHSFVLLDDVSRGTITQMTKDGYEPSVVVETSPGNHQAWVKLSSEPLSPEIRTAAAKSLAKHYGADTSSADHRHYGRLAGFTNPKPKHQQRSGFQPFVLLRSGVKRVATAGKTFIESIRDYLEKQRRQSAIAAVQPASATSRRDPVVEYQRIAQAIMKRYPDPDLSRLDFMIAKEMVEKRYSRDAIVKAITEASPALDERKKSPDYAERTAIAAGADSVKHDLPARVMSDGEIALRNQIAAAAAQAQREQSHGHDFDMEP